MRIAGQHAVPAAGKDADGVWVTLSCAFPAFMIFDEAKTKKFKARIEERSIPEPNSGCLLWLGSMSTNGKYGKLEVGKRPWRAHRLAWVLNNGPIPDGFFVCHKCDVPSCVNHLHLFLGTAQDNMDDMSRKNRWKNGARFMRGERSPAAKLTNLQVLEIRRSSESGASLARRMPVGKRTINAVRRGDSWRQPRLPAFVRGRA